MVNAEGKQQQTTNKQTTNKQQQTNNVKSPGITIS